MVSAYAKASADKKTIGYFFCISLNPTSTAQKFYGESFTQFFV